MPTISKTHSRSHRWIPIPWRAGHPVIPVGLPGLRYIRGLEQHFRLYFDRLISEVGLKPRDHIAAYPRLKLPEWHGHATRYTPIQHCFHEKAR